MQCCQYALYIRLSQYEAQLVLTSKKGWTLGPSPYLQGWLQKSNSCVSVKLVFIRSPFSSEYPTSLTVGVARLGSQPISFLFFLTAYLRCLLSVNDLLPSHFKTSGELRECTFNHIYFYVLTCAIIFFNLHPCICVYVHILLLKYMYFNVNHLKFYLCNGFSLNRPTWPIQSLSPHVRFSVCVCVSATCPLPVTP